MSQPSGGGAAGVGAGAGGEESNEAWFARASRVIPGGVDSPVRSFSAVGGTPFTVRAGRGARVTDVGGHEYLDLVQSYGAVLLGHAHPAVTDAICRAATGGTTYGAPTTGETLLCEAICERVPGCERVRLVSSGTEAAMSAVRLARGYTGRDRIVKFAGCYHGHSDGLLAGGGSGVATLGLPASAGVPSASVADTVVVPYNEVPELDERVAAVIVEPVAANMNLVLPAPGFLAGLRAACDAVGALLVYDEVITGFRVGWSGAASLDAALGAVVPDLWCFGKVIGGGLPVGAFGGREEITRLLAPTGPVYQAGTLSGNPLATAAGLAVLEVMTPEEYGTLAARVARFAVELESAVRAGGLAARVTVAGPLIGLLIGAAGTEFGPVSNIDQLRAVAGQGVYPRFFHSMLEQGISLPPGAYEVLFPGTAHGDVELAEVVQAAGVAAARVAAGAATER